MFASRQTAKAIPKARRRVLSLVRGSRNRMYDGNANTNLGGGTFGQVYLEKCLEADRTEEKRAVKRIAKIGRIDYKRELEALAVLSYKSEVYCYSMTIRLPPPLTVIFHSTKISS